MRGVHHGRNVIKIRQCSLKYLPDIEVVVIGGRHTEEVRGEDNADWLQFGIQVPEEFLKRFGFGYTIAV